MHTYMCVSTGKWGGGRGWCYHRDTRTPVIDHLVVATTFADYIVVTHVVVVSTPVKRKRTDWSRRDASSRLVRYNRQLIFAPKTLIRTCLFQVKSAKADWFSTSGLYNRTRAKKKFSLSSIPRRAMLRSRKWICGKMRLPWVSDYFISFAPRS